MSLYIGKRSKSLSNIITPDMLMKSSKLLWSDWVDVSYLNYLNLLDYGFKKKSFNSVPWFHVPLNEVEITKYCLTTIYNAYKAIMMKNIAICDENMLPTVIQKLLYVTKLFDIVYNAEQASCLYYNIAYSLLDKNWKDPDLFKVIWNTLCIPDRTKVEVLSGLIGKYRKRKPAKLLRYILENARSLHFDFWGAWSKGGNLVGFNYCPITAALLSGNVEQINTLLQYGFEPNSKRMCTYDKHFIFCINYIYDWLRRPLLENGPERRKTVTEVLLFLITTASSRSKSKRIAMGNCFRLLWNAIPTPCVTKQELQNEIRLRFLYPPYNIQFGFPTTEYQFMQLSEYYPDLLYIEDGINLQPRSLKHLCKCTIRTHLHSLWNLPTGIKSLPLPDQIKRYLNLGNRLQM